MYQLHLKRSTVLFNRCPVVYLLMVMIFYLFVVCHLYVFDRIDIFLWCNVTSKCLERQATHCVKGKVLKWVFTLLSWSWGRVQGSIQESNQIKLVKLDISCTLLGQTQLLMLHWRSTLLQHPGWKSSDGNRCVISPACWLSAKLRVQNFQDSCDGSHQRPLIDVNSLSKLTAGHNKCVLSARRNYAQPKMVHQVNEAWLCVSTTACFHLIISKKIQGFLSLQVSPKKQSNICSLFIIFRYLSHQIKDDKNLHKKQIAWMNEWMLLFLNICALFSSFSTPALYPLKAWSQITSK